MVVGELSHYYCRRHAILVIRTEGRKILRSEVERDVLHHGIADQCHQLVKKKENVKYDVELKTANAAIFTHISYRTYLRLTYIKTILSFGIVYLKAATMHST